MLTYTLFFFIFSLFSIFQNYFSKLSKNIIINLFFLFSIIFVGLRDQIGADWHTYNFYYESCFKPLEINNNFFSLLKSIIISEPIYFSINFISCKFNFSIYIVNFISSVISILPIILITKKQEDSLMVLPIVIPYLLFVVYMGYSRQSLAIGFILLSVYFWINKKFLLYFIFCILAGLSHKTAYVMLFLVFLYYRSYLIFFIGLLFSVIIFFYFKDIIFSKFITYYGQMYSSGTLIRLLINLFPFFIFTLINKGEFNKSETYIINIFGFINIISAIIFMLYPITSTIIDRLNLYTIYSQILIFSNLNRFYKDKILFTIRLLIIFIYFTQLFTWFTFSNNAGSWLPYENILFNLNI